MLDYRRLFRDLLYFLFGVALVGVPMLAFASDTEIDAGPAPADTCTAVSGQPVVGYGQSCWYGGYQFMGTISFTHCGGSEPAGFKRMAWYVYDATNPGGCAFRDTVKSIVATTGSCPTGQNWTLSGTKCTRPACVAPQTRNESTGICEDPKCPAAGGNFSAGYYDMGTSVDANIAYRCTASGCSVIFSGTAPVATKIIGGKTHYFALGAYDYGDPTMTCTADSSNAATPSTSSLPSDSCGSNQDKGTVNGKVVCYDRTSGKVADTASKTTSGTMTTETTKKDSSGATTGTESTSGTTSTTCADGKCTTTTTGTAADGTTTTTKTETDQKSFCEQNPDSFVCSDVVSGEGASTADLYTKGDKTIAGVFSEFTGKVRGSGFYSAASGFFSGSIPSGSCGGMDATVSVGWGQSFTIPVDYVFCGSTAALVYQALGVGLLLVSAWLAFKIAIL